ncbi:MAG: hypothetical protein E7292_14120 [Lachnospiraceae bacterium]|nr:hypothetical protein [Lachnospiraceae bacterium]
MKKRMNKLVCLMMLLMIIMTGCGARIPDMTDAEREAISEYAVELLMKYNANDTSRLVDVEMLEKEPEPTKRPAPVTTEPPKGMDETEDTPVIDLSGETQAPQGDIHAVLGLEESISLEYVGCRMEQQCTDPGSAELVIEAEEGKTLMICEMALINDGAKKQSVDMLRDNIQYQLVIDGKVANCMVTMLSNDLTTYLGILEPDESRKVLVLTQVEKSTVDQAAEVYLYVKSENGQGMIQVK